MQQLINDIEQWGIDRDINECGLLLQTTKTEEEVIELKQAIIRAEKVKTEYLTAPQPGADFEKEPSISYVPPEQIADIKDAIGDIFITLVMLDLQTKEINIDEIYRDNYLKHFDKNDYGFTMLDYAALIQKSVSNYQLTKYVSEFDVVIIYLSVISKEYDLTLKECVEHAYNEIKDRKGSIVDGLWKKDN